VEGLACRPLLEDEIALVVPEAHPLARREQVPLEETAEEDWVWVHEAQDADHPLYAACLQAGFRPRIVCESGSARGVLALVAAGLGIALLPRLAIEPQEGTVTVPLAGRPTRTLAVLWVPDTLSHAARAFLELCRPEAQAGSPSA
jgi:LysR family transcriptional regulator, transcription activator of glutamate synthase operon